MLFFVGYWRGGAASPFTAVNEILDPTRDAVPGANCHRCTGMTASTKNPRRSNHDRVIKGKAQYSARVRDDVRSSVGGTLSEVMSATISFLSILSTSATGVAVRAVWAIVLALVALAAIDRMKPATPRRPIPVRVDNKATAVYREPDRNQRRRAIVQLSVGSLILGGILASLVGFALAILLEVVGGLLRS